MTVEALATFLNDIGVALIRLAEGLDDRPRATVTPIAPDSPAAVPAGVESVGAPPPSAQRGNAGRTCDADGATGPGTTPPVPGPVDRPATRPLQSTATPVHTDGSSVDAPPSAGAAVSCPDCGRRLGSAKALGVHRARAHGVAGAWRDGHPRRIERVALECSLCDHVAKGPQGAAAHARGHAGTIETTPTPCPKGCGRVLGSAQGAGAHARTCAGTALDDPDEALDAIPIGVATPTAPNSRRRPTPCSAGCGQVFDWAPAAASHARHCHGPTLDDDPEVDEALATAAIDDDLATIGVITPDHEIEEEVARRFDDDEGEPDDLDLFIEEQGPEFAAEVDRRVAERVAAAKPTPEDLDPLDPGRVRYRCPDCDAERDALFEANFHRRQHRHGDPVKFTAPTRSRA